MNTASEPNTSPTPASTTVLDQQPVPDNSVADLLNPPPATANQLQPVDPAAPAVINAQSSQPPGLQHHKCRRNGRIACLPKRERDMVCRMLANAVPYKNIVAALDELGYIGISERNVSNWATGGYLEWRAEQDLVLQDRLDQDHLVDFIRQDDAQELSEAGLQGAAARLSQILLRKTPAEIEAHLSTYSALVALQCRLNRELASLQQQRNASRRSRGPHQDPARILENQELSVCETERYYTLPPPESSKLQQPPEPPLLNIQPTPDFLLDQDLEAEHERKMARAQRELQLLTRAKKILQPHCDLDGPGSVRQNAPAPAIPSPDNPPAPPTRSEPTVASGSLR